jgi:hypothetical protein
MKSLFTFTKGGKTVNSAIADSQEGAERICGLSVSDYDGVTAVPMDEQPAAIPAIKVRQRRAKATPEKPTKKQRNNPVYFLFTKGELSAKLNHDEALKMVDEKFANGDLVLIVGKVVKFSRQIRLHIS